MRGLFSPRMDYDQWKPLGRGDPLKNDPTYDYVPPVLDRVHYWIDPALRKPDPPLPGENQKTEILLLGVSSKKPSTGTSVVDRKDNFDSFLKFVDGPKFNPRPHYPPPFFPTSFYSKNKDQRIPYTMLMPPPLITKKPNFTTPNPETTTETTTVTITEPQVTIQASNLVYHSSSLGNDWKTETSTNLTPNPATKKNKPFKEEIVFQKHHQLPESYIQIQFAPHNHTNLVTASSDHNINYVTPPSLLEKEVMHKGQVSDNNLDISNTYVKIGKTEAQVHSTAIDNIPLVPPPSIMVFPHLTQPPLTMQTLQSMQSMQPPPVTTSPVYKKSTNPIIQALEKEEITTEKLQEITTTLPTTTITTSLTTDPLFKHYKQPTEPLRGPLYLIIQGHSKVKTYGPSKQFHGIRVQETNEISDDDVQVKHLHFRKQPEESSREARSGNLQTLKHVIQTGLGAIDFSDVDRSDRVKETELHFGYEVGEGVTRETYHKGIVEEARKLHEEA